MTAVALLMTACAVAASAQVAQATGKVMLKQADGSTVPVKDAVVVFYRTDVKGEYKTKTDKNGAYVHAGLPFSGVYTIVVSAPGAKPTYLTGVRVSQQGNNDFTLEPGDGSTLTLDQIRSMAPPPAAAAGGSESAEARRAREEMEKKRAAYEAEKKKAEEQMAQLNDVLKKGNEAFSAKKWDDAITFYDQGIQIDPSQSVFYQNKALALRNRGVEKYNAGLKNKDTAARDAGKADLKASVDALEKALAAYHDETKARAGQPGGAAAGAASPETKSKELTMLEQRAEGYRLAIQTGIPDVAEGASKAFQEYVAAETDPAKKAKAQANLGAALYQSGKVDEAMNVLQQVLATSPDNLDALYWLGMAMASDEKKLAEARDMLKKFVAKAPDTDPRKKEAADSVEYLDASLKSKAEASKTDDSKTKRRGKN
jgi:tetratricopeptide (TPR) repeat protein